VAAGPSSAPRDDDGGIGLRAGSLSSFVSDERATTFRVPRPQPSGRFAVTVVGRPVGRSSLGSVQDRSASDVQLPVSVR